MRFLKSGGSRVEDQTDTKGYNPAVILGSSPAKWKGQLNNTLSIQKSHKKSVSLGQAYISNGVGN